MKAGRFEKDKIRPPPTPLASAGACRECWKTVMSGEKHSHTDSLLPEISMAILVLTVVSAIFYFWC
jgi:hypothetical protein